MAQLAIKGHTTRGSEVIALLVMLRGNNANNCYGKYCDEVYYINENGYIDQDFISHIEQDTRFIIYTLEQFEEKFPHKVGDKVIAYAEGCLAQFTIQDMRWNYELNKVEYKICSSWCDTSLIQPIKKKLWKKS